VRLNNYQGVEKIKPYSLYMIHEACLYPNSMKSASHSSILPFPFIHACSMLSLSSLLFTQNSLEQKWVKIPWLHLIHVKKS
jgi:hypothetical protein